MLKAYRAVRWRRVWRRVWHEIWDDDVFGRAAQLSYFMLFSLFPVLLILMVILGFVTHGAELQQALMRYIGHALPSSSAPLVRDTVQQIIDHAGGGKLGIGIVATIWAASTGMTSVIEGLNKAYEVKEARPWWKQRIVAVVLTIGMTLLVVVALVLLILGPRGGAMLAHWFGYGHGFTVLWSIVRWPIIVAFVFLASMLVYRFAPNLHDQQWRWIAPGALFALLLWILISYGLRIYLSYFNAYSTVYGSVGAVLILLLWFYLSSAALLIGGELNSEMENSAAAGGEIEAKKPGEKAPGESRRRRFLNRFRRRRPQPDPLPGPTSSSGRP